MTAERPSRGRWDDAVARHRADQTDRILTAALELLRREGMAAMTMAALADEAGVSRPTLYNYFSDINTVLAAWVGREVQRSVTDLVAAAAPISDPDARLEYLITAQCRAFAGQDHRLSAEHFESEAASPAIRAEVSARMQPLRELLSSTIAETGARVDPDLGAEMILGMLGALRRRVIAGSLDPETAARAAIELLRQGWSRG